MYKLPKFRRDARYKSIKVLNNMTQVQNKDIKYLKLEDNIAKQIEYASKNNESSPYKFLDENALRRTDLEHDRATITRPAFMRDVEKIINVPAYNRYSGKTQVFSFVNNDDITRRGLHVQLVDKVARGIGRLLGLNTDLIEAISLAHDVGHTPFGHAGEHFLSKCYHAHTNKFFNHNVHSVRVLDTLYPRNVTLQTLDGVLCHNGEFVCEKLTLGNTDSFEKLDNLVCSCSEDERVIETLHPSTLEGCVVRVSDMIAYIGKDRSDALSMGIIDDIDIFDSTVIGKDNARIINNMTVDIVNTSYGKPYIAMSKEAFDDLKTAKKQNFELIYSKEGMVDGASNIVEEMFFDMYERLLDDLNKGDECSPIFKHHVYKLASVSRTLDPVVYASQDPNQVVLDYIASMTDDYFIALYNTLFPGHGRTFTMRGYPS